MTSDTRRWVLAVVAAVLVVGLIAFARGHDHHRGRQVGVRALGGDARVVSVATM
jgi:hypothetical protein